MIEKIPWGEEEKARKARIEYLRRLVEASEASAEEREEYYELTS